MKVLQTPVRSSVYFAGTPPKSGVAPGPSPGPSPVFVGRTPSTPVRTPFTPLPRAVARSPLVPMTPAARGAFAVTPHQPVVVRTPVRPSVRRRQEELDADIQSAVKERSAEALVACLGRARSAFPSPVHEAIRLRQVGALALLLESGYSPNEVCKVLGRQLTPLQLCLTMYRQPEVHAPRRQDSLFPRMGFSREQHALAQVLLENGADPGASGDLPETPLHVVVRAFAPPLVSLLLAKGADPNALAQGGQRPLHTVAILANCREAETSKHIAQLLLDGGADPTALCDRGLAAREYTVDAEVEQLLLRAERWWRRKWVIYARRQGTSPHVMKWLSEPLFRMTVSFL